MTPFRSLVLTLALTGSALAGAAAAAPPVTAGLAPLGAPRPTGPVTATQLNGRTLPVKTTPIPCKLDEEKTLPNHYTITFTPIGPPGELKWTAWKSCVGDAGCYLGRTNVQSSVIKNFSKTETVGFPFLAEGKPRDTCEATVTTVG